MISMGRSTHVPLGPKGYFLKNVIESILLYLLCSRSSRLASVATLACSLRVHPPQGNRGLIGQPPRPGEDMVLTHLFAAHPSAGHLEIVFTQAVRAQWVMRASLQQGPDRLLQFEDQIHIPYSQ